MFPESLPVNLSEKDQICGSRDGTYAFLAPILVDAGYDREANAHFCREVLGNSLDGDCL